MRKQWSIGKKLILSFVSVALITLVLGFIGYYSAVKSRQSVNELGMVRLPSVSALLTIAQAQTTIDRVENALLSRSLDVAQREKRYDKLSKAWNRIEKAWNIYEALPQTEEEARVWKEFVPAWRNWKKDHEAYLVLCKDYDRAVSIQDGTADGMHSRMSQQTLVVNPITLAKAEELINRLVEINESVAEAATKNASVRASFVQGLSLAAMILGVGLSLAMGILITRSITKNIHRIVSGLSEASEQVSAAASQVSSASQSLAEGASCQAPSFWSRSYESFIMTRGFPSPALGASAKPS